MNKKTRMWALRNYVLGELHIPSSFHKKALGRLSLIVGVEGKRDAALDELYSMWIEYTGSVGHCFLVGGDTIALMGHRIVVSKDLDKAVFRMAKKYIKDKK